VLMLLDTLMLHGRTKSNPSNPMPLNTIESGVSMRKETEWKLVSESPNNNLSASFIIMSTWSKDIKRDGGVLETTSTKEDGEIVE